MLDSGRYIDKAGFGNRRLHAINDEIDFRSQISRILHVTAYKTNDFIVLMAVNGMSPRYGSYHPHGFHIKRSRDNPVVHVDNSLDGVSRARLARSILRFEIVDIRRQLNISTKYRFRFSLWICHNWPL